MTPESTIERDFRRAVCESVRLIPEGLNRYRVFTPFTLDDGDHLGIVLKQDRGRWLLTDEGHTFMHLTYQIDERDLLKGTRAEIITDALEQFAVRDDSGELRLAVPDEQYGDALYSFVQALLKISDVSFLTRERVRSTFLDDFREAMTAAAAGAPRVSFDWHDPTRDPEGIYSVDCRVENSSGNQLLVYALANDDRTRDATISLLQFERWGQRFRSCGIFENQEGVNRKVLARFSDVCEKQFSALAANHDRINAWVGDFVRTPAS